MFGGYKTDFAALKTALRDFDVDMKRKHLIFVEITFFEHEIDLIIQYIVNTITDIFKEFKETG